jgi:hypothetical protein
MYRLNSNYIVIVIMSLYDNFREFKNFKESIDSRYGSFIVGENSDELDNLFLHHTQNGTIVYRKQPFERLVELSVPEQIDDHRIAQLLPTDLKGVEIMYIYHGVDMVLFHNDGRWYTGIGSKLDLYDNSNSNPLIPEADLDITKVYRFILNRPETVFDSIINLNRKQFLLLGIDNLSLSELKSVHPTIPKPGQLHFSCLDELQTKMALVIHDNRINKKITFEGYRIIYNNIHYFYRSDLYLSIKKQIPSTYQNVHQIYFELYQLNKLADILPYLSKYSSEIIHRINMSMRTISKEILNIYHATRKLNNKDLYHKLPKNYKKIIYSLHGIYITNCTDDMHIPPNNKKLLTDNHDDTKSITVHDVYYHLKNIPIDTLIELYKTRSELIEQPDMKQYFIDCIYTLTHTKLL